MKTINVYEFKDLDKETKKSVYNKVLNEIVESHLEVLALDLQQGNITEDQYYNALGCTKYYVESTSWFIPSCYYEKNKSTINQCTREDLRNSLFTSCGRFIQYID